MDETYAQLECTFFTRHRGRPPDPPRVPLTNGLIQRVFANGGPCCCCRCDTTCPEDGEKKNKNQKSSPGRNSVSKDSVGPRQRLASIQQLALSNRNTESAPWGEKMLAVTLTILKQTVTMNAVTPLSAHHRKSS